MSDKYGHERLQGNSRTVYDILGRDSVHPFPARMAPSLALDVVSEFKEPQRVLDPMSGSGTVLAVAHHLGHHAIGVDIDPLAVLISRVWTTPVNPKEVRDSAAEVLSNARSTSESLGESVAYPRDSDEETKRFVRFWFDPSSRQELAALSAAIDEVYDDTIRNALWCAFSRLIITKKSGASLAMDMSHSRPHRVFKHGAIKAFWQVPICGGTCGGQTASVNLGQDPMYERAMLVVLKLTMIRLTWSSLRLHISTRSTTFGAANSRSFGWAIQLVRHDVSGPTLWVWRREEWPTTTPKSNTSCPT